MPHSFLAQVYDLGDPWAAKEKGWSGGDPYNCSLPDPATGKYGPNCTKWDPETWSAGMQPYATLIRANDPSGLPGINFMGGKEAFDVLFWTIPRRFLRFVIMLPSMHSPLRAYACRMLIGACN